MQEFKNHLICPRCNNLFCFTDNKFFKIREAFQHCCPTCRFEGTVDVARTRCLSCFSPYFMISELGHICSNFLCPDFQICESVIDNNILRHTLFVKRFFLARISVTTNKKIVIAKGFRDLSSQFLIKILDNLLETQKFIQKNA